MEPREREVLILITGGSGFVGSNLATRLADNGKIVRATYRSRAHAVPAHAGIESVQVDLTKPEDCAKAVDGVETVFMCAAQTSGAAIIRGTPLAHVTPNVMMNTLMLEAACHAGVKRFVFISTGAVYPDTLGRPVAEHEALDDHPYDAYFAAGWMKRYAEILCKTYAEKIDPPMPCIVVRPANIYGPRDKFGQKTSHVTAAIIRKVFEKQVPLELWGSGEDVRDVIYIDDFIDGLLAAANTKRTYLEVNIASGAGICIRDILETAMQVSGHKAEIRTDPSKPTTIPILLFDTTVAESELEFTAKIPLDEGIRRTLAWLQATPESVWSR